jgi:electron transport complex protein RnfC
MRQLHRFPGGLKLADEKGLATGEPLTTMPLCHDYVLPLLQHEGDPAKAVVKPGQRVLGGEVVARADGWLSLPVHAPTSGVISDIAPRPIAHPSGLWADCIVLAADGEDRAANARPGIGDPASLHPSRLRNRLRECGVAGLGGAAFPAHIKLNRGERPPLDCLILNGAQCEPYISCDDLLLREHAREVVAGGRIMRHALECRRVVIAIEDNVPEAGEAVERALAEIGDDDFELVVVPAAYPEGGERQLIQVITGREVPSGGLPADIGVVCHNVGTAAAAARAVHHGEALVSRVVTVTGRGAERTPELLHSEGEQVLVGLD